MTGNRAINILEWAVKQLETSPIELTQFEKTLLERCKEQERNSYCRGAATLFEGPWGLSPFW